MFVPFKEILKDAYSNKYAVGAFNCLSLENAMGAIQAAEELRSPIIIQLAEVQFPYSPMEKMAPVFIESAEKASIPVCVHLDHGQSLETCVRAMKLGFQSIMYDGANLPLEENIRNTKEIVRIARALNVDIEAELGKVGNANSEQDNVSDIFTDVDELDKKDSEYGIKAARVLHELQKKGYETSVDVVSEESDRFREIMLPCLPYIDYLIINEVEAGACCHTQLRDEKGKISLESVKSTVGQLLALGVNKVCAVHFPEGGYAARKQGETCYIPSIPVDKKDIVSPVGAGDAFCAGMLYALHENQSLQDAVIFANTSARFNLRSATSTGGAPCLSELEHFIHLNYTNHEKK